MTNITINIPHELRIRLQKEENQSGLITELLTEHFQKDKTEEEILKEVQDQIEVKQEEEDIQKRIEEQDRRFAE